MRAIGSRTVTVRVVRDPPPRVGAHVLEPELRLPPYGARTEMHAEMHAEMRARDGTRRAPISRSARLASPYTVATSPGRRAAISCLSSLPHAYGGRAEVGRRSGGDRAFEKAFNISSTEYPTPVPRLYVTQPGELPSLRSAAVWPLRATPRSSPGSRAEIFAEIFAEIALGEVDHVDVVAHARAVGGRVVGAEDREMRPLTHRDLRSGQDRAEIAPRLRVGLVARISRRRSR